MNNESQPARHSSLGTRHCSLCDNTGWKSVMQDGVHSVIECDCRRSKKGFEPVGSLIQRSAFSLQNLADAALTPVDKQIRTLIETHVGQKNALRIRDLAGEIWPEEMADPQQFDRMARAVKESVERLRVFARVPIAATKVPPYGYFIPETAAECDAAYDRYVQEGIRLFLLARLFKPRADLVERLRGQLGLEIDNRQSSIGNSETGAR